MQIAIPSGLALLYRYFPLTFESFKLSFITVVLVNFVSIFHFPFFFIFRNNMTGSYYFYCSTVFYCCTIILSETKLLTKNHFKHYHWRNGCGK